MVIAAVRTKEELEDALKSPVSMIFHLNPNILTLTTTIDQVHEAGKKLLIHMDLADGIGKDRAGIYFAKKAGVDGIISTRVKIIKDAREAGLYTVQRFFAVDSQSVQTTIEAAKNARPNMIEIMPGMMEKVIVRLKQEIDIPVIAGGLVETKNEIKTAMTAGATAVSTGVRELWYEG